MAIPADLEPFASSFSLPTGAEIRWQKARDYGLEGWSVKVSVTELLYSDGSVASLPRYRAYGALGLEHGEDSLQGQPGSAWQALSESIEGFSRLAIMPLQEAWDLAREHGYGNRAARDGEEATLRTGGERVTVVHGMLDGGETDVVIVRGQDGEERPVRLHRLALSEG
jgi:hypothetical protein